MLHIRLSIKKLAQAYLSGGMSLVLGTRESTLLTYYRILLEGSGMHLSNNYQGMYS